MKWQEVGAVLHGKRVERMLQRIAAPCDNNHDKEEMPYILSEVLHIIQRAEPYFTLNICSRIHPSDSVMYHLLLSDNTSYYFSSCSP